MSEIQLKGKLSELYKKYNKEKQFIQCVERVLCRICVNMLCKHYPPVLLTIKCLITVCVLPQALQRNVMSTIFGIIFLSSSFLCHILFSQKGLSQGYEILHGALSHKKNKIWGKQKIGGPPLPPGVDFLGFFRKKTKSAQNRLKWREN